jgi:hypothetical protein
MLHRLVEAGQLPPLTDTVERKIPGEESVPRPPKGYVVSFVAFHERGFSVPAERFIWAVLFEYGLQFQHLNPNNIQQMAAFEAMCEGYLRISAHWHLFKYFFMFVFLKDASKAVMIGCANLRMKQDRGDDYTPFSLTSSNSGWHKGWFYLRNDPEFALLTYTGNSITQGLRCWTDVPSKAEQAKLLKDHWAVLTRLRQAAVDRHQPVSRPGGGTASKTAAAPLRDDGRQGPLGRDLDPARAPITGGDPAPRGTSNREVNLLVATSAASSNAPQ